MARPVQIGSEAPEIAAQADEVRPPRFRSVLRRFLRDVRWWFGVLLLLFILAAIFAPQVSPYDPLIYLPNVGLAFAQLFCGNFDGAASAASRASSANPRFSVPRYLHVAALARLGRRDEAKAIAKVLLEVQPSFTISSLVAANITTPERLAILAGALREAGLPE